LTEEGTNLIASSFAYGPNYLKRNDARAVNPVSLSIADRASISGSSYLLPANALSLAASAMQTLTHGGRRVIEARLKGAAEQPG
jgi:serine/threonine-protein kinase HipA